MKSCWLTALVLLGVLATAQAGAADKPNEVFKGRLFAPNVILEHQDALELSREQFTAIKAAVVEVQGSVAEHEWDMREAYRNILAELDEPTADEDRVLQYAEAALAAENRVKLEQMRMLVRLRNILDAEQLAYLKRVVGD